MKPLLKIVAVLAAGFAATFLLVRFSGALSVEQIEGWLLRAQAASGWWVASIVVTLLVADILIAVPTLTLCTLAGFFLGPVQGAAAALTGLLLAGASGLLIGRAAGDRLLGALLKDEAERAQAVAAFQRRGVIMILLSRSSPMLPEVCACLAGMTGMKAWRFWMAWALQSAPYAALTAWAGSRSTLDDPRPALFAAIGLYLALWSGWYLLVERRERAARAA